MTIQEMENVFSKLEGKDPEDYEDLHDHINDEDDIYNESWNDFKRGINSHSKKLMFHISDDPDLDKITMEPRVPSYIVEKSNNNIDPNYPEDASIPRICVSPSIEGCIIATFSHTDVKYRLNDLLYVYTPIKPFDAYEHKTNKELVKEKLVFDANITGEAWILEPCKMRLFGIIRIKKVPNMINKETVNKGIRVSSGSFDWEWVLAPKAAAGWFYPDEEPEEGEEPVQESYVFDKANYEQNLDKWAPGTPLWIAGASGDGKSTLAKKYAKEHKATLAPLDIFLCRIAGTKEKFEKFLKDDTGTVMNEGSKIILDYIDKHPEITWAKSGDEYFDRGQNPELWNQLFNWLLKVTKNDPKYNKNLYIFEGCSICMMDVDKAKKLPIIVTGTSRLTGSRRRMHRDTEEHSDYSILKVIWRELKRITSGNFKKLNDNKDKFIKNLSKTIQESDEGTTKGYRYTDGRDGQGIYEALKSEMYQKNGLTPAPWREFLDSDAAKWLPKPPKYDKDNESWFTEEGNEKFKELTLPIVKEYIKNIKVETKDIPNERIVYLDEYQFITDNSIPITVQEATLSTKERNKLDDSEFGIPELRKYPLTDKKHVRSAVSYFHKAPGKYKPQLAKRILRAAHKYGMDTENWDTINEYAKKKSHVQESFIPLKREHKEIDHVKNCISYAMGVDDSINELKSQGFGIIPDGEDYKVRFNADKSEIWESYINKHLKDTYWNEYINLNTMDIVFMIKENDTIQRIENHNMEENDSLLETCNRLCEGNFKTIKDLIYSNDFYKEAIENNPFKLKFDNPNIHMRPATEDDIENMYQWEMESIDKSLIDNEKVQSLIRQDCHDSLKDTLMIMDGDNTIGMFTACMIDDGEWRYIGEIYLIPEYRGQGIGSTILKNEMANYDKIRLQVAMDNEGAFKLYTSLGFKIAKKDDANKMYIMEYIKPDNIQEFVDPIAKMKDDVTGSMNFMNYLMKVDLLTKGSVSESLKQLKHSAPNGLHPVMFMGYMDPEGVNRSELKDLEKQVIYADDEGNIYSCFFNSHARRHEISQIASSFETFINDLPKRKVTQPNIIKAYANPMIELEKDGHIIHSHHELPFTSLDSGSDGCYMNTYYSYFAILEAFEFKRNQLYHDICNVILDQFDGDEDKFDFRSVEVKQVNWATAEILFRFKYDNDSFIVVIRTVSMRTQPAKLYHDNSPKNADGDAYVGGDDFEEIDHNDTNAENTEDGDASMTEMCIGSNDYGVCYQEYADNGKIKVNNVPYNMMYFGSYKDFGNNMLKLDNPRLFVTPFKGIASIFTIDRSRYMIPKGKSCNLAYDEWKKDTSQLDKPFDDVHVKVEGIPEMEHRSFENEGWIYGIDISNLKDHIYQEPWMDSEREFLILDVHEIPIAMKLNHKTVVYVEGADKNEVKDAPTDENVFYSNHREPINEKTVKKFMKKGKADLTTGLQHLPLTDKLTGYLWDTKDGNVVAYVAVEEKKDGNWISGLELSDKYQNKGYGKQLLDFAENELNADHLSVNKSNKSAIDLYSNNGWETYKDDADTVYMKKNLSGEQIQEAFFGIGFGNLRKVIADKLGSACTVTNVQNPTGKEEKFVVKLNDDPEDFVNVISTGTGVKAYGYKHGERFSIFNNASLSAAAPRLIEAICDAFNIQKPVTEAFEFFEETVTVDGHRLIELAYYKKLTNLTPEQEQILQDYANARDQLQAAAAYYTRETKARKKALKRMQLEHNTSKSEYQRDQLNRKMARTRIELDVLARDYAEAYQRNVQTMNQLADKFDEIELSKKNNPTPSPMNDTRDSITIPIPKILRKPRELLGSFLNFEDEKDDDTEV